MKASSPRVYFYRAVDAAITAPLNAHVSNYQNVKLLIQPGASNHVKMGAFINIFNNFVPGTSRAVSNYLMRSDNLPLPRGQLTLLSYGTGSTVYRYENANEAYVVKTSRRTLGKPPSVLLKFSEQYRENFNKLDRWYNKRHCLVVPSLFLIIQSTLLNIPCVACIQGFVHGEQEDLLRDYDDAQIIEMMRHDERLGVQFKDFVWATVNSIRSEGLCFDMLGKNNLMLLTHEDGRQLVIVDYGIFNLDTLARHTPEKLKLVDKDIKRLKALAKRMV
jgi:hypothetical protein